MNQNLPWIWAFEASCLDCKVSPGLKKKNQPNQRNTRKRRRRRRRKREREKEKYVGGRQITNRSKQKNIDCWLEVSSTFGFPLFISLATHNSPYLQSPSLIIS